jgi:hypothetical protein
MNFCQNLQLELARFCLCGEKIATKASAFAKATADRLRHKVIFGINIWSLVFSMRINSIEFEKKKR